jgi:hypothetical protein
LDVDQPGATVTVDDVAVGTTPLSGPVSVDMGPRVLRVTKEGFQPWTDKRQFSGDTELLVNVHLVKEAGLLGAGTDGQTRSADSSVRSESSSKTWLWLTLGGVALAAASAVVVALVVSSNGDKTTTAPPRPGTMQPGVIELFFPFAGHR